MLSISARTLTQSIPLRIINDGVQGNILYMVFKTVQRSKLLCYATCFAIKMAVPSTDTTFTLLGVNIFRHLDYLLNKILTCQVSRYDWQIGTLILTNVSRLRPCLQYCYAEL